MKYLLCLFIVLSFTSLNNVVFAASNIRLEIENMARNSEYSRTENYKTDTLTINYAGDVVSAGGDKNGVVARLEGSSPDREPIGLYGAVETPFTGPTGYYNVYIQYVDEHDGSWESVRDHLDEVAKERPIIYQRYMDYQSKGIQLLGGNGTLSFSLNDKNDQFFIISNKGTGHSRFVLREVCRSIKMISGEMIYGRYNRSDNWREPSRMDYIEFVPVSGPSSNSGCVNEKESPSLITDKNTLNIRPKRPSHELDLNKDGTFNVVDLLFMLTELFGRENPDVSYLDVNKDGLFNISDLLYMLNQLF